jgi:hypothetical protein
MEALQGTADMMAVSLEHIKAVEEVRRTLRDIQDRASLTSN